LKTSEGQIEDEKRKKCGKLISIQACVKKSRIFSSKAVFYEEVKDHRCQR
jgi:hypothetical protein